jgi:protein-S-isoprenylcysteine O-methyltransferase Ste14
MFLALLVSHLLFENPASLWVHPLFSWKILPLLVSPGVIAFLMNTTEFELIRRTGVVTLCIGGIFKEVLTVLGGTIVFGDHLAVSNIWGVLVTLGGIVWYNYIKIQKMREEEQTQKEGGDGYEMINRERLLDEENLGMESVVAENHVQSI